MVFLKLHGVTDICLKVIDKCHWVKFHMNLNDPIRLGHLISTTVIFLCLS